LELAMAAYNSGEVMSTALYVGRCNEFLGCISLFATGNTNYVPNILATILIANNPTQYDSDIFVGPQLVYDRVRSRVDEPQPARTASDTSIQYLRYLNPRFAAM
jgi:hypothetical protein